MHFEYFTRLFITIIFLIGATITDIQSKRIPNKITFTMMLIGLIFDICTDPSRLIMTSVMLVLCFLFSLLPGIGMGDVKLLMGMSFFLNPVYVLYDLGLASILVILIQFIKNPTITFWNVFTRRFRPLCPNDASNKNEFNSVPFAPYLLTATLLTEGVVFACSYLNINFG